MRARLLICLIPLMAGCSTWTPAWNKEKWDLNRYRDPRAADIDKRLSEEHPTPVRAPFSSAEPGPE